MSEAVIAIHEGDETAVQKVQEEYVEDAEDFWASMGETGDKLLELAESDEEDGDLDAAPKNNPGRKNLQRGKVWKWLLITYHMLSMIFGVGWLHWQQPKDLADRAANSLDWPSLTISIDQGSDGWSACHFLRSIDVNLLLLPDVSHRTWNDTQLAIQDSEMWFWCLICVTLLNMDTGPWDSFHWWTIMKENIKEYATIAKDNCPILRGCSNNLEEDLELELGEDDDDYEFDAMADGATRSFQKFIAQVIHKKFPKVGMCRWFQFIHFSRDLLRAWTARFIIVTYYLIMLGTKALHNAAVLAGAAKHLKPRDEEEDIESGATKLDREEVRTIRGQVKNNLGFCHTMFSNRNLWRQVIVVFGICKHAEKFERQHTSANRSADESVEWWAERADDLGFLHVTEILGELEDTSLLMQMGNHYEGCSDHWLNLDVDHPLVDAENASAEIVGGLVINLAGRRLRTLLTLYKGWPGKVVGLASKTEAVRNRIAQEILLEGQLWETKIKNKLGAFWKKIQRRSPWNNVHTQQIYGALMASKGVVTPEIQTCAREQFSGITHSEIVEDAFRELKGPELGGNFKRTVSDTTAFLTLIRSKIAGVRHRYSPLQWWNTNVKRKLLQKPPKGLYQWSKSKAPTSFRKAVVTTKAAGYPSYAPLAQGAPIEDYALLSQLDAKGELNLALASWLCALAGIKGSSMMVRNRTVEDNKWFLSLGTMSGSTVLALPVFGHMVGDACAYRVGTPEEHCMLEMTKVHQWEAASFTFKSSLWLRLKSGMWWTGASAPIIRTSEPEALPRHCVRRGMFRMPLTGLRKYAKHVGCAFFADGQCFFLGAETCEARVR